MKGFLIITAGVLASTGACSPESAPVPADVPTLVEGNTGFAMDMFDALCREVPDGNVFFSPYSISSALAMTWAGARGGTADQMASVLGFEGPGDAIHAGFAELSRMLRPETRRSEYMGDTEPLTLEIANAIWIEATFPLLDSYVDLVSESYGAEARNVDFTGAPDAQRELINDWVEERTRDRIRDLLAPGTISDMTRVVLTNAVYFKATWMNQFNEAGTRPGGFETGSGAVVETPMMRQIEHFPYAAAPGCIAVSLPYSDGLSSMLILLPDDIDEFTAGLDAAELQAIRDALRPARLDLSMPSFEFTSEFSLKETLEGLGMTEAFDGRVADFSGFTGGRDLFVSAVVHKAFVKVDETGTEAAAATAVVMVAGCAPPVDEPIVVRIDRPFVFMVIDDLSGTVLFMGRVTDPSAG